MKGVDQTTVSDFLGTNRVLNSIRQLLSKVPDTFATQYVAPTVDYAYITMSGNQSSGILTTNPIQFNTLLAGNMSFDPSTYRVTLKANKTYIMRANVLTKGSGNTHNMGFNFYNVTTSSLVGADGYVASTSNTGNDSCYTPAIYTITTAVDTVFEVRINGVTALTSIYAAYSCWEIQQIGVSTAVTGTTGQYAYVSPMITFTPTPVTAGYSNILCRGQFAKTSDGTWLLLNLKHSYNIGAGLSASTVRLPGIIYKVGYVYQACSVWSDGGTGTIYALAWSNTGDILVNITTNRVAYYLSANSLELDSKPTGYGLPSDV